MDASYVGIKDTLHVLGPLLKSTEVNDKATIVTLFLNAVPATVSMLGPGFMHLECFETMSKVAPYIFDVSASTRRNASPNAMTGGRDAEASIILMGMARDTARDMDFIFDV